MIDMKIKVGIKQLLEEAEKNITTLDIEEVQALLNNGQVRLIDIRDIREIKRDGQIPGSFHCPRGMLEFWIDPESPYYKPVFAEKNYFIFYCAGGWRSALAAQTAQIMGLDPVAHMKGGFRAWKKAGYPVKLDEK